MKRRKIINGRIFTDRCRFEPGTLYMAGERLLDAASWQALSCRYEPECAAGSAEISAAGRSSALSENAAAGPQGAQGGLPEAFREDSGEEVIDASGCYVIPGMTDIHFHGCVGSDCCDGTAEAFRTIASYEARCGVTAITPATMTMSEEVLTRVARAAAAYRSDTGAVLAGLYMEGPFINIEKKGAQNGAFVRKPDRALFERLQMAAEGKFRTVVVAPETEGAFDFIRGLAGEVTVSLAHMTADYDTAKTAIACGARQLTHTWNAMPPFSHRAPGPIGAAAEDGRCMAELICDGIHVHPSVVRATFRLFGDDRVILISDSMRAAGMPDGVYDLGGQAVHVKGNRALLSDGTIAGSVTNLPDCLRTAVLSMGIPLESAVRAATINPARAVGIDDEYGSLTPGKYANVVLLREGDLALRGVYVRGTEISL